MWQAFVYAFQQADEVQLTVIGGFVVLCVLAPVLSLLLSAVMRLQSDHEPRATPSERGLW